MDFNTNASDSALYYGANRFMTLSVLEKDSILSAEGVINRLEQLSQQDPERLKPHIVEFYKQEYEKRKAKVKTSVRVTDYGVGEEEEVDSNNTVPEQTLMWKTPRIKIKRLKKTPRALSREYQTNHSGETRGQLIKSNPRLYGALYRADLLHQVPKKPVAVESAVEEIIIPSEIYSSSIVEDEQHRRLREGYGNTLLERHKSALRASRK